MEKSHVAALKRAIKIAGGQKPLADKMRPFCGEKNPNPSQALVWNWLERESYIPPEWWLPIEKATDGKVTGRDLRPDLPAELFS